MRAFYGDIHNHCAASYGHGSAEDALYNAWLQLDFCSVTGHSSWPDMRSMAMPSGVIDYHERGFARLAEGWSKFVAAHATASIPERFVSFPSNESQSLEAGDYAIYHRQAPKAMFTPKNFSQLQEIARTSSGDIFIAPHYIDYANGIKASLFLCIWGPKAPDQETLDLIGTDGCELSWTGRHRSWGLLKDTNPCGWWLRLSGQLPQEGNR